MILEYIFCRIKFKRMSGQLLKEDIWYVIWIHRGTCIWYTFMLCFTKKGKKDRGHLYFSIVFHQSTSFSLQKKVMNYTGNRYIPEGFTGLRILYTLVMDQIPIKCDMNDLSLCLKKGVLCQMYVENWTSCKCTSGCTFLQDYVYF